MSTTTTTTSMTVSTPARPTGPDRASRSDLDVVAFFAIAYGIAWTTWLLIGWAAADSGLDTAAFLGRVEAGELDLDVPTPLPTWALYGLSRVIDFSFSIAGLAMIVATTGRSGLRRLLGRLTAWRLAPRWYAVAVLPAVLYGLAAAAINASLGGDVVLDLAVLRTILFSLSAGLFVSLFLRGAMGEELGLRGFVLPRLQARTTPFRASLLVGVLWGGWHLPVLLGRDLAAIGTYLLVVQALTFLFTWVFNRTSGSLVPVLLLHATINWEEGVEAVFPAVRGSDWETLPVVALLVAGMAAAVGLRRRPLGSASTVRSI